MQSVVNLPMAGEVIALAATLSFVLSNVIFRKCEHEASPLFINTFRTLIGVITFFAIAAYSGIFHLIFSLSLELWIWLILSFVFGQVLGDTSYFMAQKELGPTKALAISMTYPLFSFLLSVLVLHQKFEWWIFVSFIFITSGVLVIAKAQIKESQEMSIIPDSINSNKTTIIARKSKKLHSGKKRELITPKKTILAIGFAIFASLGWAAGLVIIDYATNQINNQLNIEASSSILGNVIRFPAAFLILSGILIPKEKPKLSTISKQSYFLLIIASIIGLSLIHI